VPSIVGRSPSYIVRQLYDLQSGARAGAAAQRMKAPVARLTVDDMVSIAAYLASLHP
jgi:cytochrome c553